LFGSKGNFFFYFTINIKDKGGYRVDPLAAIYESLEQPLPPTTLPSPVIKITNPKFKLKSRATGQVTFTNRGVQHYRRDLALVDGIADSAGTKLENPRCPK